MSIFFMLFVAAFHDTVKRFFIGSTPDGLPFAASQSKIHRSKLRNPPRFLAHCFTLSSSLLSAGEGGSARPPRYLARKFLLAALKAMLFPGWGEPWPSSGKNE